MNLEQVLEDVRSKLAASHYTRRVQIEVSGINGNENLVILSGQVPTFFLKQMAQFEAGRALQDTAFHLKNELQVR